MRALLPLALISAAACAEDADIILRPPDRLSARSMVLAVEPIEGGQRVFAASLTEPVLPIRFEAAKTERITALLYDQTLSELSLEPGELARATAGTPSRNFPRADEAFVLSVSEARDWTAHTETTIDFPIPALAPCPTLEATALEIDSPGKIRTAVKIDDASVLVFLDNGEWWRVTRNSATHLYDREDVRAAFHADDGDLWILTSTGTLLRGDLERGFTETATIPIANSDSAIDGSHGPAPFELFMMINKDTFARYDDRGFTIVEQRAEAGEPSVGVAWVGPGEALAMGPLNYALLRYQQGTVTEEAFQPAFDLETPSGIFHDAELGSFAGTEQGFLYRRSARDPGWRQVLITGETFGSSVEAMASWRDGIALGIGRSQISFFFDGYAACPLQQFGDRHYKALLRAGDDLVIAPDQRAEDRPPYSILWLSVIR